MKLNINYQHLGAEFVIVFFGVAIALAADSWRSDLQDQGLEQEYFERLLLDLETGHELLTNMFNQQEQTQSAARSLAQLLDSSLPTVENEPEIATLFLNAAAIGGDESSNSHDVTYVELISTGRLNIIRNPTIRTEIANYYRLVANGLGRKDDVPRDLLTRFMQLTGKAPVDFPLNQPLEKYIQVRIANEVSSVPEIKRELRELDARIGRYLIGLNRAIRAGSELTTSIRTEIQ